MMRTLKTESVKKKEKRPLPPLIGRAVNVILTVVNNCYEAHLRTWRPLRYRMPGGASEDQAS